MAKGGKREGSGRKPGGLNRKTVEAITVLNQKGCEPLDILADIAMGKPVKSCIFHDKETGEYVEGQIVPTLDQRKDAAKELAQYKYPKRKAVEHSGSIGSHEATLEELANEDLA